MEPTEVATQPTTIDFVDHSEFHGMSGDEVQFPLRRLIGYSDTFLPRGIRVDDEGRYVPLGTVKVPVPPYHLPKFLETNPQVLEQIVEPVIHVLLEELTYTGISFLTKLHRLHTATENPTAFSFTPTSQFSGDWAITHPLFGKADVLNRFSRRDLPLGYLVGNLHGPHKIAPSIRWDEGTPYVVGNSPGHAFGMAFGLFEQYRLLDELTPDHYVSPPESTRNDFAH